MINFLWGCLAGVLMMWCFFLLFYRLLKRFLDFFKAFSDEQMKFNKSQVAFNVNYARAMTFLINKKNFEKNEVH